MQKVIGVWLVSLVAVFVLYVGASLVFFNHTRFLILGMPPMLFWYTLVPFLVPLILGALYLYDQRADPDQQAYDDSIVPEEATR